MKIAILDMDDIKNPFWGTGQSRATRQVGSRLAKNNHVVVYSSKYPGYNDYEEDGIKYKHIGIVSNSPQITNLAYILSLPFFVKNIKADIIIENFNAPFSINLTPVLTKIPIVALPTMFNAKEFAKKYHFPFDLIEAIGMKNYKYILPYSNVDKNKAVRLNPSIKYKIVPQGVGQEFFKIKRSKPKYILYFGRLDIWQKGADLMIEAYAKIKNRIKYPLVIAGHGSDKGKIEELIKKYKLQKQVSLVGPIYGKEKEKYFANAIYNIFPSRHDEICLATLEVLAAGLPVVCFDLPESKWITDKVSLKARFLDTNDLSKKMVEATNIKLNTKMSVQARELAKGYSWDRVAQDIENFLRLVIKDQKSYNTSHGKK